jgi:crotonobetainyl-CoA:carnitine CoA-transferase CaiB-like acyl-CoA transferase
MYMSGAKKMTQGHKKLPLQSIKIVDFTRLLPGPFCTQMLADYGAEVIKIEEPSRGDYNRWFRKEDDDVYSAVFGALNRNKKSICVDLKTESGMEAVKKLMKMRTYYWNHFAQV